MPPTGAGAESAEPDGGELEELRRRVTRLETAGPPRASRRHPVRATTAVLLIVLASVLSMLAVVSVWARDQVTDTDRFVATMGPLAGDPQVQDAVTNKVTAVVVQQINVPSLVGQLSDVANDKGVPPQASALINALSGPIGNGLTSLIGGVVNKVVTSDAFATIWTNAIRGAHTSFEKALTGEGGGAVRLTNNQVSIDIGPVVDQVKTQLAGNGFGLAAKIPTIHTQFVVYSSPAITKIKVFTRLLQVLGNWLPLLATLVAAGGVHLAKDRRRALFGAAVGVGSAMLVLGIALTVFRTFFIDQFPPDVSSGAAGAVYDALTHFLRQTVRMVGVLAVLVALGAFFVGPSEVATTVRAACSTGIGGVRQVAERVGFRVGPVEPFLRRWKHWTGIAILLIASVVFVIWGHPTGLVVFWFALVILAAFAIREFLAPGPGLAALRQAPPEPPTTSGSGPRPATDQA